jgi:hypothetical protein
MAAPMRPPTSQGTRGASRGRDRNTPTSRMITAMLAASAGKSMLFDQPGAGRRAASRTGGLATGGPHTARASSTPSRDPVSWAAM